MKNKILLTLFIFLISLNFVLGIGDLNGDSITSSIDYIMVKDYINGKNVTCYNNYKCDPLADLTGENSLNNIDENLYKGLNSLTVRFSDSRIKAQPKTIQLEIVNEELRIKVFNELNYPRAYIFVNLLIGNLTNTTVLSNNLGEYNYNLPASLYTQNYTIKASIQQDTYHNISYIESFIDHKYQSSPQLIIISCNQTVSNNLTSNVNIYSNDSMNITLNNQYFMNLYNNNTITCGNSYSNITINLTNQNSVWNYFNFTFVHSMYTNMTSIIYNNLNVTSIFFNSNNFTSILYNNYSITSLIYNNYSLETVLYNNNTIYNNNEINISCYSDNTIYINNTIEVPINNTVYVNNTIYVPINNTVYLNQSLSCPETKCGDVKCSDVTIPTTQTAPVEKNDETTTDIPIDFKDIFNKFWWIGALIIIVLLIIYKDYLMGLFKRKRKNRLSPEDVERYSYKGEMPIPKEKRFEERR